VTPTHNRRESVVRLLDRLRDGSYPSDQFEVVVVADDCADDTVATLAAAAYPFSLRVLEQVPGRGAAAARTLGAAEARGTVLMFIDDDIEPLPGLLETHARLHMESHDLVMVGAPIPVRGNGSAPGQIASWAWWEQQFERMRQSGHRFTYDEVFSGILSVRADRFERAGGFKPEFNNCRDDSDLGYRLFNNGGHMAFLREAGGLHHEVRDYVRFVVRKRAEGRADVLLVEAHPELWPVVRLSSHLSPPWSSLGALRRLAFGARGFGDAVSGRLMQLIAPLTRFGLHGTRRAVEGGVMYYNYWRGVATHLGDRAAFDALAVRVAAAAQEMAALADSDALDLDLSEGLEAAERAIDAARPLALHVRLGDVPVGDVHYEPGAEPLRGRHLRRLLATRLAGPLAGALTLADVKVEPTRTARAPGADKSTAGPPSEVSAPP
ncbi:MAG: glycosyltransferase family A protein, partial [bacterium]